MYYKKTTEMDHISAANVKQFISHLDRVHKSSESFNENLMSRAFITGSGNLISNNIVEQLTLTQWLTLIKCKPNWWIFRGPFNKEYFKDDYKEQLINFLIQNPALAQLYFDESYNAWTVWQDCECVRDVLSHDDRIMGLKMVLI